MTKKPSERALELFAAHYNCAQSVFAACAADDMLTEAQRLAIAAAFGGGMARQGEVCGALTGALMALGERGGKGMATDPAAGRDTVYTAAGELMDRFRAAHGSVLCHELTGCRLNTEEGQRVFKERNTRGELCAKLIAFAADEAAKIH
jgi:C_GCAxxG_C_C family probable redox protein